MKYILVNDIEFVFNKMYKFLLSYLMVLILFCFFNENIFNTSGQSLFYKTLSLDYNYNESGPIENVVFFFQMFFYIYLVINLFIKDVDTGISNLFLRIKPTKWIIYKTISITFLSTLILGSIYLLLYLKISITGVNLDGIIVMFLKHVLTMLSLEIISLLVFIIFPNIKLIFILYILLIPLLVKIGSFEIINFDFIPLVAIFTMSMLILFILYKYKYVSVFENN